jgi:hypothetical protein
LRDGDPFPVTGPLADEPTTPSGRGALFGLVLTLAVAAALRLYRIDFDLPEVQYVDGFKFAGEAGRMVTSGDLRPKHFQYPGLYVNVLVALYYALGVTSEYGRQLTAAMVSAVFGFATVSMTVFGARKVSGGLGVLVAAGLAAVSPAMLTASRTPSPDMVSAFFMTTSLVLAAGQPTSLREWAVVGASAGLGASAKWTGLLAWPAVLTVIAAVAWRRANPALFLRAAPIAACFALAAFLVTTPFFLSLRNAYLDRLAFEAQLQRAGQIGRVQLSALDYFASSTPTWEAPWLGTSLLSDLGPPALLASLGGTAVAATGRLGFAGAVYAASLVAYLIAVSGAGWVKALRFLLPALPLLWMLAGAFVEWVLPPTLRGRPLVWVGVLLTMLAAPIARSWRYAMALGRLSTNTLARQWIHGHIAPNSVVFLGPFFTEDIARLPLKFLWLDVGGRQYGLPPSLGPSPERNPIYTPELVDEFNKARVDYVVLNSYFDDAFARVAENERYFPRSVASYEAFRARIRREATLAYVIRGWREGRLGPDISVWRLGISGATLEGGKSLSPEPQKTDENR